MNDPIVSVNGHLRPSLRASLGRYLAQQFPSDYGTAGLCTRLGVDLVFCNAGFAVGYLATITYHALTTSEIVNAKWIAKLLLPGWLEHVPLFTLLCALAFLVCRVYAPRRRVQAAKIVSCLGAVALAYLLCTFLLYSLNAAPRQVLPRSTALAGLVASSGLVAGARFGKALFSKAYIVQARRAVVPRSPVDYVVVIGGAGYIGSTLVRQLLDARYRVRVLDTLMFGDKAIRDLYTDPDFELIVGDFRNVETVARAVHGMDAVIHLGAIVGDPACALDPEFTLSTNARAVLTIRDICSGCGVGRFLFASTCSVYGAQDDLIDEHSPLAPVSLYARSKIDAEQALLATHSETFHPTVLRLATAFGQSYRMRFDLVANLLTARALTAGKITIFNGHQWRPFIHVKDIARGFLACLQAPLEHVSGQVFNLGDNHANLTLKELGELVARVVPGTQICHESNPSDPRSYRVDFTKVARQLGFRCTTPVDEGLREMARSIQAGAFGNVGEVIYNNAAFLQAPGKAFLAGPAATRARSRVRFAGPIEGLLGLHSRLVRESRLGAEIP